MVALRPVWVPYSEGEVKSASALRAQRTGRTGPNGEPAESGRWKLALPGGATYDGPTVSASALGTASECMWKWGLDRIDNVPRPENHKGQLGNDRHDELEAWLKFGKMPYTKGMAQALAHFPMPGQCESEVYFGFMFGRPGHEVIFSGYLDGRESVVDVIGAKPKDYEISVDDEGNQVIDVYPTGLPGRMNSTIRDLKTTSSFDWKKTAAQLRADIQACMYGLGEMLRVEAALLASGVAPKEAIERSSLVILKWTYALLKENKDKTCTIRTVETVCETGSTPDPSIANGPNGGVLLTREQAVATVASYLPVAESMLAAIVEAEEKEKKRKESGTGSDGAGRVGWKSEELGLGKNGSACASYGGCGWKKIGSVVRIEKKRERIGQDWKEWDEKVEDVACSPPNGSGFMAQLRQERLRLGIETKTGVETRTELKPTQAVEKKMGLASRFGTRTGTNGTETSAKADQKEPDQKPGQNGTSSANGVVSKNPPSATPATTIVVTAAPSAAGGLKSRFAKTSAPSETSNTASTKTVETSAKLEEKAQTNGMSSSAGQPGALQPGVEGLTLVERLTKLNEAQGGGAAIEKAAANAPTNTVGAKAVGINPPDAAPEWTAEQQAAEAARLAGKAEPSAVARATPETAAVATTGRGGRRSKKAETEAKVDAALAAADKTTTTSTATATSGPVFEDDEPITVAKALAKIDDIATQLMKAGFRKEAGAVMQMSAALA